VFFEIGPEQKQRQSVYFEFSFRALKVEDTLLVLKLCPPW
jgi:hypothetical protein